MNILALAAIAPVAAFLLLFFFYLTARHPTVVAIASTAVVAVAWEIPNIPPLATVAGLQVYFLDLLAVALLILTVARTAQMILNVGGLAWIWLAIGALFFFSFARGASTIGLPQATSEFRAYFYPFAALGWAISAHWDLKFSTRLLTRLALTMGWLLSAVAFYHIARHGLGSTSEFVSVTADTEQTSRALVAGQALMLLLCAIACLHFWKATGRGAYAWSAVLFTVVIVLTQERTVWVAALCSAVAVGLTGNPSVKRRTALIVIIGAAISAIAVASGVLTPLINTLVGAAQNLNTFEARIEGWTNLVRGSVAQGTSVVLFGEPFGQGYGRLQSGVWVTYAPHNWYLSLYLRSGVIGLGLFVSVLILLVTRALRARTSAASIAIIVALIAFGWTYSWPWYICIFLGWAAVPLTNVLPEMPARTRPEARHPIKGGSVA
ncbi:O-antigen ligase [Curtobacterium sp. MCPF17_001]|uniref:O-antigen ligase family protein n=1 Tax=Curtobacterium sp. MCPF17_001 TaxID=2175651 RepID=UPI0011B48792|nr:hypothetical protein [Curtobacterium sp. MCPF17_001]